MPIPDEIRLDPMLAALFALDILDTDAATLDTWVAVGAAGSAPSPPGNGVRLNTGFIEEAKVALRLVEERMEAEPPAVALAAALRVALRARRGVSNADAEEDQLVLELFRRFPETWRALWEHNL